MTHHTDAERQAFEFWLGIKPCGAAHDLAWSAWKAARSAPAAPVPHGWKLVPVVPTSGMLGAADREHAARGLVSIALISYQAMLAAAPQPPEAAQSNSAEFDGIEKAAAPVQLPEPVAFALEWTFNGEERGMRLYDDETHCRFDAESDGGVCQPLYTEQQVRELLAAAKVERDPLTDSEIESATGAKRGTPLFLAAKGLAIAIERAHGIGKDKA